MMSLVKLERGDIKSLHNKFSVSDRRRVVRELVQSSGGGEPLVLATLRLRGTQVELEHCFARWVVTRFQMAKRHRNQPVVQVMSARKNVGSEAVRRARRLGRSVGKKERATATQRASRTGRSATRKAKRPGALLKKKIIKVSLYALIMTG